MIALTNVPPVLRVPVLTAAPVPVATARDSREIPEGARRPVPAMFSLNDRAGRFEHDGNLVTTQVCDLLTVHQKLDAETGKNYKSSYFVLSPRKEFKALCLGSQRGHQVPNTDTGKQMD